MAITVFCGLVAQDTMATATSIYLVEDGAYIVTSGRIITAQYPKDYKSDTIVMYDIAEKYTI